MLAALLHAWRSWMAERAVGVLAAVAFAVGIGSATAIFTVVNGVMLKPVPYAEPDRFVALYGARFSEPDQRSSLAFPDVIEYQQKTRSFDVFGSFTPTSFNLVFAGQPQHIVGVAVTTSLAHNLGVNPALGQWFRDDQGAVISDSLWKRLGADATIVGRALTLDGRTYTITGVMPPGFRLPVPGPGVEGVRNDVWIALDPMGRGIRPSYGVFFAYARLKPGVTFEQAEADVKRVAAQIAAADPLGHPSYTARLDGLRQAIVVEIRPTLLLLAGAAGLLLLITCADVAGLLLARSVARARETAMRVALGAARGQLALHYFIEGLIVSLAGAAAGILISIGLVRVVLSLAAEYIPRADEVTTDWRVFLFALAAAAAASALASLAPLWQAARTLPADVLSDGIRASASARTRRLSHSLVVGEIALAFALLSVSVVFIVHLRQLGRTSPGFNPEHLVAFRLTVADSDSINAAKRAQDQARWVSAVAAIPGVSNVGFASSLPLEGCCFSTTIFPEGRPANLETVQRVSFVAVSSNYFQTAGIPMRKGRVLDARDVGEMPLFIVVNEAAARTYWPDRDAIGAYGRISSPQGTRFQIVGVVGDVRNDGLGKPTVPEVYLTSAMLPVTPMRFVVRSALPPETLVPLIRRAIQTIDPVQPIHRVVPMTAIVEESVARERLSSLMMTFFALAALLMASLGIYGVVSYAVRQGTVEIGTRMALGAMGSDLLMMVLGRGLRMAAYGAAFGGIALVLGASSLARAFEIPHLGILPFVSSMGIVVAVAVGASFFPAWRATQLSPMVAIRNDAGARWLDGGRSLRQAIGDLWRSVSLSAGEATAADPEILTQLVAAARGADSFDEAFRRSLATLCERFGAASAMLLERTDDRYRCRAAYPVDREADISLPVDGFLTNRLTFYSFPLPFTTADLESWKRWSQDVHEDYVTDLDLLLRLGVRIAVPLRARSEILGILLLGASSRGDSYTWGEKQVLRQCADQLTLMIENARLTSRVVEQERLRRDLALAAEVQKRLLPSSAPAATGAAFAAVSLPARTVGGDYYDFLDLGDQRIGIALADIAGKGIPAALLMAVVQASLRSVAGDGETSLPQLAAKINELLHRSTGSNGYATFFYAQLDERRRQLRYVNAGHNPPYLVRGPEIRELSIGGTVLGLFPQMTYEEATVDLQSGDVVLAFTDGVTEALNVAEEEFGEQRLKDLVRSVVDLPADQISARIAQTLKAWIRDTTQYDDLTFVVLKVA